MNRQRFVMVVAVAFAITVFSPAAAVASKIDNDTRLDGPAYEVADFWLDCGIACGNYWKEVEPGDSRSRPGKGGHVQAAGYDPPPKNGGAGDHAKYVLVCERGDRVTVGDHGEVGLSYTAPGDPHPVTFTWTSKGGNNWTGTIRHSSTHYTNVDCWGGTP